jgi:hypothetical protein
VAQIWMIVLYNATSLCLWILLPLLCHWETHKHETVFSYEYVKVWTET